MGYLRDSEIAQRAERSGKTDARPFHDRRHCVNPGPTDTEGFRQGKTEQQIQFIAGMNPVGRLGQPDEIAAVISFLAGESSAWVNGQILRVNGGMAV
ncbi:hypothetical protein BGZ58_004659 [Dissophora ornata]|nr:hypothetical protein BGZ58_004659 [Dissophora ornata]